MGKKHSVILTITNKSGHNMTYTTDWFYSGRVSNGFNWPQRIPNGAVDVKVPCYERDGSMAGCSGYVTYDLFGTDITIAFSNPAVGNNTLGVGTTGKSMWEEKGCQNYGPFEVNITLHDGTKLLVRCDCSGGETNLCNVQIEVDEGAQ